MKPASQLQVREFNVETAIAVVFNWVAKVIRVCLGFALLRFVVGYPNSRHFFNQSEAKWRQSWHTRKRFPALGGGYMYLLRISDWLIVLVMSLVIGQNDYFGFGITTLSWNQLCTPKSYIPLPYKIGKNEILKRSV